MERLKRLRLHLSAMSFMLFVVLGILSVAVGIGLYATFGTTIGIAGAVGVAFFGAALSSVAIGIEAMKPTEFLARAILHVSKENSTVAAPELSTVPASKEFFEHLAKNVYELASQSLSTTRQAQQTESVPQAVQGTSHDALLGNVPLPVFALNQKNEIIYINQAALDYTGIAAGEVSGKPMFDVVKLAFASDITLEQWLQESSKGRLTGSHYWDRVKLEGAGGKQLQCDLAVRFNKDNPDGVEAVVVLF